MKEVTKSECKIVGIELTDKARLYLGVLVSTFAVGLLVMLLVGLGYKRDSALKDVEMHTLRAAHTAEIETLTEAHKNERAAIKATHTREWNRSNRTVEMFEKLEAKIDMRCGK